jgi:peptide/nickel transport system permease protein
LSRRADIAIGGGLLLGMVLLAVLAPFVVKGDPRALSPGGRLLAPSAIHWFGTDQLGRDLFVRVLYGARISLFVGFSVALLSSLLGTFVGMLSASDRRLDAVVMRIMDGIMSIPAILLAIALMAVTGGSVVNVIVAVTIVEIPRVARLIRGVVLSLREQPYVEAAVAAGTSRPMIVVRHLLPGIVAPLIVQATFVWATAMILEAALSFIGAGTPPATPSWGNILADARALWQIRPTLIFFPAAFLFVTLLAVNLLGDGLRDVLDPQQATET